MYYYRDALHALRCGRRRSIADRCVAISILTEHAYFVQLFMLIQQDAKLK